MDTFIFTIAIFLGVVMVMSVGVVFSNKPIKGSCGGIAALMGDKECEFCESKAECDEFQAQKDQSKTS